MLKGLLIPIALFFGALWYMRKNSRATTLATATGFGPANGMAPNANRSNINSTANSTNGVPDTANWVAPLAFQKSFGAGGIHNNVMPRTGHPLTINTPSPWLSGSHAPTSASLLLPAHASRFGLSTPTVLRAGPVVSYRAGTPSTFRITPATASTGAATAKSTAQPSPVVPVATSRMLPGTIRVVR